MYKTFSLNAALLALAFLFLTGVGWAAPPPPQTSTAPMPGQTSVAPPMSGPPSSAPAMPPPAGSSGKMSMPPPAAMVLQQMHMVNQFEIKAAELAGKKATSTRIRRYADRLRRDHMVADAKVKGLAAKLGYELRSPQQMKQMMMQMMQQHASMMGTAGSPGGQQMPMKPMHGAPPPRTAGAPPAQPMPPMSPMQKMQKMKANMQMMQQAMDKLQSASGPQFDKAYIMTMIKGHEKAIHMLEQVQAQGLDQPQVTGLIHKLLPILKQHLQLAQDLQSRRAY